MPRIREIQKKDFRFVVSFVLLNLADLVLTVVNYERERNPFVLLIGKEIWPLWKLAATAILLFFYFLDIWSLRQQKWYARIMLVLSLSPFLFTLAQIIMLLL